MKPKTFALGLVVGILLASVVNVAAANEQVQVWLVDNFKMTIDGQAIELPDDYVILNYKDRIYTPVRVVAEGMDGAVVFDAATNTAKITKPTPPPSPKPTPTATPEPIPESTPEPTPKPTATPKSSKNYSEAPAKQRKEDVTVNIFGLEEGTKLAYLWLDISNKSNSSLLIDLGKAYIEVDGKKLPADASYVNEWSNTLDSMQEWEEKQLVFEGALKGARKISIHLPFIKMFSSTGEKDSTLTFDFDIEFD